MPELADWAGIPIRWGAGQRAVEFDPRLSVLETKARRRGALRPVVASEQDCQPADAILYWMYNGISLPEHSAAFARLGIQYELTLIYPDPFGSERAKTLGHSHGVPAFGRLNAPEVVEVLAGEALFFFQSLDTTARAAPFVYAIRAGQGDKVIFPPNLHHLTINAGDKPLLFSDLIGVGVRGDYEGLSAMGGAAYLYGESGWTRNPKYADAGPLEEMPADEYPELGLVPDMPLYQLIQRAPDLLTWLNHPEVFASTFPALFARVERWL
jgi:glucose-6-phosphate isomerase